MNRTPTFNGLGTIQPDFNTPRLDSERKRSNEYAKSHPYNVSRCYKDKTLTIRDAWQKCFSGREEYA